MYEDSPFKIDGIPVKPPLLDDLYEWNKVSYAGNDILANFSCYIYFFWRPFVLDVNRIDLIFCRYFWN